MCLRLKLVIAIAKYQVRSLLNLFGNVMKYSNWWKIDWTCIENSANLRWLDPVILWGYHPTLKPSGIPTFTLIVGLTYNMDKHIDQSTIWQNIFGDRRKCHVVIVPRLFGVWVEILLLPVLFREKLSATYSSH